MRKDVYLEKITWQIDEMEALKKGRVLLPYWQKPVLLDVYQVDYRAGQIENGRRVEIPQVILDQDLPHEELAKLFNAVLAVPAPEPGGMDTYCCGCGRHLDKNKNKDTGIFKVQNGDTIRTVCGFCLQKNINNGWTPLFRLDTGEDLTLTAELQEKQEPTEETSE